MRLIDANALKPALLKSHNFYVSTNTDFAAGKRSGLIHAMDMVDASPTVNAVQVVMCRDCKYWFGDDDCRVHSCELDALLRPADWYCAGGRRRNE